MQGVHGEKGREGREGGGEASEVGRGEGRGGVGRGGVRPMCLAAVLSCLSCLGFACLCLVLV